MSEKTFDDYSKFLQGFDFTTELRTREEEHRKDPPGGGAVHDPSPARKREPAPVAATFAA